MSDTSCCPHCRLVQAEGAACLGCGSNRLLFLARDHEKLERWRLNLAIEKRGPQDGTVSLGRAVGETFLIGLPLMFLLFGLGELFDSLWLVKSGAVAFFLTPVFVWRKQFWLMKARWRRLLTPVQLQQLAPPSREVKGVARRLAGERTAPLSGRSCLAWTLTIKARPAEPHLLWHGDGVDFWLESADVGRVLVRSPLWLDGEPSITVAATELPPTLRPPAVASAIAEERIVEPGDEVVVSGIERRQRAGGAGYRDEEVLVLEAPPGGLCAARPAQAQHEEALGG